MAVGLMKGCCNVVQGNELEHLADQGSDSSFSAYQLCDLGKAEQPL